MQLTISVGNTTIVELQELTNAVTGAAITDATVTMRIADEAGTSITGQTWPLTLAHVSAGTYRGAVENDVSLSVDKSYTAIIDATASGVGVGRWTVPITATRRT